MHLAPVPAVAGEIAADLLAMLLDHVLQLARDVQAVVGEAHDLRHRVGAQQMLDGRLQMLPQRPIAADAAHGALGVGVIGNVGAVPLRLRPARRVREIVGNGEDSRCVPLTQPMVGISPSTSRSGCSDPVRPLDVVGLHPAADRLIDCRDTSPWRCWSARWLRPRSVHVR